VESAKQKKTETVRHDVSQSDRQTVWFLVWFLSPPFFMNTTDRQTDRQRDRQTDRQRDRQTDRQPDMQAVNHFLSSHLKRPHQEKVTNESTLDVATARIESGAVSVRNEG